MNITLDVEPDLEAALKQRADASGLSLPDYIHRLAELDVHCDPLDPRVQASLWRAESLRGKIGVLPGDSLSHEGLYADR